MMDKAKLAFSLVELSIVLVILGLLTGGILTGQSLIRAAELRAVSNEFQQFQTALNIYNDKYLAKPGDMVNATSFWTGGVTYNGNGDGITHALAGGNAPTEHYIFWQHLALAGLIEGTYTGLSGTTGPHHSLIGTNVPSSKISNAGWTLDYWENSCVEGDIIYDIRCRHSLLFGAAATDNVTYDPILSPEEAWNIDTKMDDGKPARGKIIAMHWNDSCAAADDNSHSSNNLNASYKLSDPSTQCSLMFINLW